MDHSLNLAQIEKWSLALLIPSKKFEIHSIPPNDAEVLFIDWQDLENLTQAELLTTQPTPTSSFLPNSSEAQKPSTPEQSGHSHATQVIMHSTRKYCPTVLKDEALLRALLKLNHPKTMWKKSSQSSSQE